MTQELLKNIGADLNDGAQLLNEEHHGDTEDSDDEDGALHDPAGPQLGHGLAHAGPHEVGEDDAAHGVEARRHRTKHVL